MILIKDSILPKCKYYPERSNIFRVFSMPINDIKVVILGQDPYFNGEANGLAFSVNRNIKMPASLKNIYKEVNKDYKVHNIVEWKTLEHWHKQGVFLLNTALTVEAGEAGTHIGYWQWFTREIVKIISLNNKPIFILWGSKAKSFKGFIHAYTTWLGEYKGDFSYIIEGNHPAVDSYPNSEYKFIGCNHFRICNQILKLKNKSLINW